MEAFALVEADFQQYYHLNLSEICPFTGKYSEDGVPSRIGFMRYARLFANLPKESRSMLELNPTGTWSWQDETLSRILLTLDGLWAMYYNMHREKGSQPAKTSPQFQPDYIKAAKDVAAENERESKKLTEADKAAQVTFWQSRNPDARQV